MKKGLFLLLLFCSLPISGQNQEIKILKLNSYFFEADDFLGHDKFGFRYFIINNTLNKQKDSLTLQYKNVSLGKIARVDLQNPLKIVLFYENFNTVVTLDNQLNETQKINFSAHPVPIVAAAIGMASQNRLWVYNSLSQQIGLFDYLKLDYKPLTVPFTGRLKFYEADFNYFHWIDDTLNRYTCDVYGKVSNLGKVPDFDHLQFLNSNWLLFSKDSRLYAYDVAGNKTHVLGIDEKTFKSFTAKDQILSIFTSEGITNYKIIIP